MDASTQAARPEIWLKLPCVDDVDFVIGFAEQIRTAGLFVATDAPPPVGAEVALRIVWADEELHVSGLARVTASGEADGVVGITLKLESLDPESFQFDLVPSSPLEEATGALDPQSDVDARLPPDAAPVAVEPLGAAGDAVAPGVPVPPPQASDSLGWCEAAAPTHATGEPVQPLSSPPGSEAPVAPSSSVVVVEAVLAQAAQVEQPLPPVPSPSPSPSPSPYAARAPARALAPRIVEPLEPVPTSRRPAARTRPLRPAVFFGAAAAVLIAGWAVGPVSAGDGATPALETHLRIAAARIAEGALVGPGGDTALDHLVAARALAAGAPAVRDLEARLASDFERRGDSLLAQGDVGEAGAWFQAAVIADPARPSAAEKLDRLEARVRSRR